MELTLEDPPIAAAHAGLTRIQRLIAQRMLLSKRTKPCFYLESKVDVTDLMALRPTLRKSLGIRVTSNTFFIHALALAAKEFPMMLGKLCGEHISIAQTINVGFAVNSTQGLVVPVIKDADKKNLAQIANEEELLTVNARSNKLTLADIEGETIALSNLGVYGVDSFFGIVPPPTSTILAVGNVIHAAVPLDGEIVPRKIMSLTLAVDGRVVGEVYAARFFDCLKDLLQNPQKLTLA